MEIGKNSSLPERSSINELAKVGFCIALVITIILMVALTANGDVSPGAGGTIVVLAIVALGWWTRDFIVQYSKEFFENIFR